MKSLAAKLLTATFLAAGALATPALAGVGPVFDFQLFEVTESSGSCSNSEFNGATSCGKFFVRNNTDPEDGIDIIGFLVGNPASTDVMFADAQRDEWIATVLSNFDFGPFGTQNAFAYGTFSGNAITGGTSDDFFWALDPGVATSPVTIEFTAPGGVVGSCTFNTTQQSGCNATLDVPEPITLGLLGAGLLGLTAVRRRRGA
jgi:hypothetical protein